MDPTLGDQVTPKMDPNTATVPLPVNAPSPDGTPASDKPNKRQKVAIACDVCRAKKVKCDSVRPVCGPCSKRQHGAPCEYTTVTRTSHGPTKGYVHHLELKLRELQAGRDLPREINGRGPDESPREQRPLITKSPISEPPANLRSITQPFAQVNNNNNWGTPIQWPQRPPEDVGRTSMSAGPPSSGGIRDSQPNGSTPVGHVAELHHDLAERPSNGRPNSFMNQLKDSALEGKSETREGPNRSPGVEPNALSSNIRKRPRSVDYILPSRKTADGLVETYWDTAHALFPIIDYEAFNTAYQAIWSGSPIENESQIMCTLNVIFALASSFTDSVDVKQRIQSADVFFERAQDLFEMDLWNASKSVDAIQCLLLICQYLQSRAAIQQGWVFIGLAISMAESLGLHLSLTDRYQSDRQKRNQQMTWHGCLYMKRIYAVEANRPSMIDKLAVTMVPKPFKHMLNIRDEQLHFFHSLLLNEILDQIMTETFNWKSVVGPNNMYDLTHETVLSSVSQLDGQLSRWRLDLPAQLTHVSHPHGIRTPRQRQANAIRLQYYNARILLFRPTLLRWVRLQIDPQNPTYSESFQAQTSLTCSTLCLHSSLDMIEFIFTRLPNFEMAPPPPPPAPSQIPGSGPGPAPNPTQNPNSPTHPQGPNLTTNGPQAPQQQMPNSDPTLQYPPPHHTQQPTPSSSLPAHWNVISYLHTSALILLASRLNRTLCLSVPGTTLEDAFNTAAYCLRSFAKYGSPLAARSLGQLEGLAVKTERARMDIGDPHLMNGNAMNNGQVQGQAQGQMRVADLELGVRELGWVEGGVYTL